MDSKHFPSHSTTDNLPSSLSNPGERPPLTTPPQTTTGDTAGVTTSSTNTGPAHLSSGIVSTDSGETTCISTSHSDASTQNTLSIEPSTFEHTYKSESLSPVSSSTSASPPCNTSSSSEGLSQAPSSDSSTSIDSLNSLQKQTKTMTRSSQTSSESGTGICEGSSTNSVASQTVASSSDIDILAQAIETERASPTCVSPHISPSSTQEKGLPKEKDNEESMSQRGVKR